MPFVVFLCALTACLFIDLFLPTLSWLLIPAVWGLLPCLLLHHCIKTFRGDGIFFGNVLESWAALWRAAIVLSLFIILHKIIYATRNTGIWQWIWPTDFVGFIIYQTLYIAIPEEIFFRGYLQTNCKGGKVWRICYASTCFAMAHLVLQRSPAALLTWFPGILLGWLREKSGSLLAPIICHILCNIIYVSLPLIS